MRSVHVSVAFVNTKINKLIHRNQKDDGGTQLEQAYNLIYASSSETLYLNYSSCVRACDCKVNLRAVVYPISTQRCPSAP